MTEAHWTESEKSNLMRWIGAQDERDKRLEERDERLDRSLSRLRESVEHTNGVAKKALSRVTKLYWFGGFLLTVGPILFLIFENFHSH